MKQQLIEQIKDFKNLLKKEIDLNLFFKLISHCTDGEGYGRVSHYANNLTVKDWLDLYKNVQVNVNDDQIIEFFEYLRKYYSTYFHKVNGQTYAVGKRFDTKESEKFELEQIVFYSINL